MLSVEFMSANKTSLSHQTLSIKKSFILKVESTDAVICILGISSGLENGFVIQKRGKIQKAPSSPKK